MPLQPREWVDARAVPWSSWHVCISQAHSKEPRQQSAGMAEEVCVHLSPGIHDEDIVDGYAHELVDGLLGAQGI